MPKATWNGELIAEADIGNIQSVEGNVYFPPDALERTRLEPSDHTTLCPWKGTASYYHVVVGGQRNENAAWYYPEPKDAAKNITDHVAFWKGVAVEE